MRRLALTAALCALFGCGDGSLVESEVNPELADSVNPEVNPTLGLDAPISVLGL